MKLDNFPFAFYIYIPITHISLFTQGKQISLNSPTDLSMLDLQCLGKKTESEICLLGNAHIIARGI